MAANNTVHGIRAPQPVNLETNIAENWKLFRQKWQKYAIIAKLSDQEMSYQVALLLHTLGDEPLKIYNGFHFDTPDEDRTVNEILEMFDSFAVGEINETYERFVFNKRDQKEGENFECFLASIRSLIRTCNYCDQCIDSILRDRIVLGVKDPNTQTSLLKERQLTLTKCIDLCKAAENANAQGRMLRPKNVNKVDTPKQNKPQKFTKPQGKGTGRKSDIHLHGIERPCKFCGFNHIMKKAQCPAWGKTCSNCNHVNHFAKCCPNKATKHRNYKAVNQVYDSSSSDDEWINAVYTPSLKDLKCHLMVSGTDIVFQIDTGASVNIIPERYAHGIVPTHRKLKMWNRTELSPLGKCRMSVRNPKNNKKYFVEFVVVKENLTPLIGLSAAEQMSLISVNSANVDRVCAVTSIQKHSKVFDGFLGTFAGTHHLNVDETITPVMANRRVPIAVRPKLKAELDRLTTLGVIEPVDQPTPWVSQLVTVQKKSGDLRICLDPRELNKALLREHYTLPVLEDTLHELSESRVFSKADLSCGYWHVQLDSESSLLTTFQSPFGRYCWRRLPFGTKVSSEIFQKKLAQQLEGLTGVVCLADDVIIHGKDDKTHDENLEKFLTRCEEKSIQLNKDKLELRTSSITFMGHCITANWLQTDPEKVKAICDMPAPNNLEELRRFLGIVNYLARFLPHLTDVVQPLQNLTRKDVPWTWSDSQQNALDRVKHMVTNSPVLVFYNPEKELTLENDASDYGLGSALFQDGRPIAYASRSLSDAERRYAQIEKEMLAVSFGLSKFHHYTYGRSVTVITDHKPLVAIASKPLSKAPKRLQALLLRTQEYNYDLFYKPGTSIPVADALSRAPLSEKPEIETVFVNNLSSSPIRGPRMDVIRVATQRDKTLQLLKSTIMQGWPTDKNMLHSEIAVFHSYRDELTVQDGIVLRGERVVIPSELRPDIKQKVHAGHMGINSCLRRACELVFWPGMTQDIRQYIETCETCATFQDSSEHTVQFCSDVFFFFVFLFVFFSDNSSDSN